jgi:hypothetical protein
MTKRLTTGVSTKTARNVLALLQSIFSLAVDMDVIGPVADPQEPQAQAGPPRKASLDHGPGTGHRGSSSPLASHCVRLRSAHRRPPGRTAGAPVEAR